VVLLPADGLRTHAQLLSGVCSKSFEPSRKNNTEFRGRVREAAPIFGLQVKIADRHED
jgi:hypothetical protein